MKIYLILLPYGLTNYWVGVWIGAGCPWPLF